MKCRKLLCNAPDPFDIFNTQELFVKAVKENCQYHYDHCAGYRKILDSMGFKPGFIETYDDIPKIPFLPTLFFKHHHIYSVPSHKMIKVTSTGTTGKFSIIGLDLTDLLCGLKMVLKIGKWRELFSLEPANYIILGYQPHRSNQRAVTKTAFGATLFTPALSRT